MSQIQELKKKLDPDIQIAVETLRANSHKQIYGQMFDGFGRMCAQGALRFGFGLNDEKGYFKPRTYESMERWQDVVTKIDRKFIERYHSTLSTMNDRGLSFDTIADKIEELFNNV